MQCKPQDSCRGTKRSSKRRTIPSYLSYVCTEYICVARGCRVRGELLELSTMGTPGRKPRSGYVHEDSSIPPFHIRSCLTRKILRPITLLFSTGPHPLPWGRSFPVPHFLNIGGTHKQRLHQIRGGF